MAPNLRGSLFSVAGMAALLAGRKWLGLSLFAKGFIDLERGWRERYEREHGHAFYGGAAGRWEAATKFYEQTHQNPTNRVLHIAGIPFIALGAAGLLAFRPYKPAWIASAVAFAGGWATNIVGHAVFEKNAPAFRDDPLSFIAGPIWDIQQVVAKYKGGARTPHREPTKGPEDETSHAVN
jgi:hypothetical protein